MIKFSDLIYIHFALFMFDYHNGILPSAFDEFFIDINRVHQYNTRLASKKAYYLPKVRTNYGKFNIRFLGVKIWNSLSCDIKTKSRSVFKRKLINSFMDIY